MQKSTPIPKQSALRILVLLGMFLFHIIVIWVNTICRFLSRFCPNLQSQIDSALWRAEKENPDSELSVKEERREGDICREDVEFVMGELGFSRSQESEELQKWLSPKDISRMFDDKQPLLEEIREAFCVFDLNKDGFIDELELQRVLCNLGLKEGGEVENCKKMIRSYDRNGDGRIDFDEFVEIMENSFS